VSLGVLAQDRFVNLGRAGQHRNATLITPGVVGASVSQPDGVSCRESIGASQEALIQLLSLAQELKAAFLVETERTALLVSTDGLRTRGVLDDTLTHTAAVDNNLLAGLFSVEEKRALVEPECGVVDVGARRVLLGGVEVKRVVGCLELCVGNPRSDGRKRECFAVLDLCVDGSGCG